MGSRRTFEVKGQRFASAAALERHLREMLDRQVLTPEEEDFVKELFGRYHPRHARPDIIGASVEARDGGWGFRITFLDGSRAVSWRECLAPSSRARKAKEAFREAIRDQIVAQRDAWLLQQELMCAHCGRPLDATSLQVDHHPQPFSRILERFLEGFGLEIGEIEVTPGEERKPSQLADEELRRDWAIVHEKIAKYVPSCGKCNASIGSRKE